MRRRPWRRAGSAGAGSAGAGGPRRAPEAGGVTAVARAAFRAGTADGIADLTGVADRYLDWARAAGSPEELAEAYWMQSVATAREAMRRELPAARLRVLARSQDIASEAGYHLAVAGRLEDAVIAAEHSRGVLLTRLVGGLSPQIRAGLLAAGRPDLLRSYLAALRRRADAYRAQYAAEPERPQPILRTGRAFPAGTPSGLEAAQAEVARLTREIGGLVRDVTALDLPGYPEIREVARRAPVVYLGAAGASGYALIVRGRGEPGLVTLPDLDADAVSGHRGTFARPSPLPNPVHDCVDWLAGRALAGLVPEVATEPEIALVPLGALNLLPVGAALIQATARRPGGPLAVRYLPNARVAAGIPPWTAARDVLVVDGPPGEPPLRRIRDEADALASRYGTEALHDATGEVVLDALSSADVVQFMCHGRADLADPLSGGLLLKDGWLTVQQLLGRPPLRRQLVILAACESQVSGTSAPDEVIGLPAALYQAGAAGVVAAQWQVEERAALVLLRRFHDHLDGGHPPARALAAAQAWLRTATSQDMTSRYPDLFRAGRRTRHAVPAGRDSYVPYAEPVHWAAFGYTGV
jgi:hypothetical protein